MKRFFCLMLALAAFQQCRVFAQSGNEAILQEASQLNKAGQYADAAAKYAEVLKLSPNDASANYGMAVALYSQAKSDEAIPYLQKAAAAGGPLSAPAYSMLGGIYDKQHNAAKAIDAYVAAIKAKPDDQRSYYNLGLVYFREKQYGEAEKCAVQAIRLDPKHAASQRMYALVCFHQNKRANALLGLCSFILLQPDGPQAAEAFSNIQHIIQGGTLKAEPGASPILSDGATIAMNSALSKAVADAAKEKHATAADLLAAQLTSIFKAIGPIANTQSDAFFKMFYADYFYRLSQSQHIPAFARLVSQSQPESADWIKNNPQAVAALMDWAKTAERAM